MESFLTTNTAGLLEKRKRSFYREKNGILKDEGFSGEPKEEDHNAFRV